MTDARSQELLEFPGIRARLAALTAFAPSRRLAEAIEPSSEPLVVKRWLDETDEARDIHARRPTLAWGARTTFQRSFCGLGAAACSVDRSCCRSSTRS